MPSIPRDPALDSSLAFIQDPYRFVSRHCRRFGTDRWIAGVIRRIRAGALHPPEGGAAHIVAWHLRLDGTLFSPHVAAVGLLNVLRPTIAVSVCMAFVAHALHQNPDACRKLAGSEPGYAHLFMQKVRRWITIELMRVAADMLGRQMRYHVPDQDLRIDFARLPARPRSRFVLCDVSFDQAEQPVRPG